MAKKAAADPTRVPLTTIVDCFYLKGKHIVLYKGYEYQDVLNMPVTDGWRRIIYQVGYGQFNPTKTI